MLIVSELPSFLNELGFHRENPVGESVFSWQLAPVKASAVVVRGVVANGEARPLCVVVLDISFYGLSEVAGAYPVLFNAELGAELLLYPAVQGFVDGVVGGLACP